MSRSALDDTIAGAGVKRSLPSRPGPRPLSAAYSARHSAPSPPPCSWACSATPYLTPCTITLASRSCLGTLADCARPGRLRLAHSMPITRRDPSRRIRPLIVDLIRFQAEPFPRPGILRAPTIVQHGVAAASHFQVEWLLFGTVLSFFILFPEFMSSKRRFFRLKKIRGFAPSFPSGRSVTLPRSIGGPARGGTLCITEDVRHGSFPDEETSDPPLGGSPVNHTGDAGPLLKRLFARSTAGPPGRGASARGVPATDEFPAFVVAYSELLLAHREARDRRLPAAARPVLLSWLRDRRVPDYILLWMLYQAHVEHLRPRAAGCNDGALDAAGSLLFTPPSSFSLTDIGEAFASDFVDAALPAWPERCPRRGLSSTA